MWYFPYQLTPILALCALSKSLPNCSLKSVWAILAFWPLSKSLPNCSLKSDDVNPSFPSTPPPAPAAPVAPFPTPAPLPPPPLSSSSGVVMMILVAFKQQEGVKRFISLYRMKKNPLWNQSLANIHSSPRIVPSPWSSCRWPCLCVCGWAPRCLFWLLRLFFAALSCFCRNFSLDIRMSPNRSNKWKEESKGNSNNSQWEREKNLTML